MDKNKEAVDLNPDQLDKVTGGETYNSDGSTYNTVTCPNCGRQVSMAEDACPYCHYDVWGNGSGGGWAGNAQQDAQNAQQDL